MREEAHPQLCLIAMGATIMTNRGVTAAGLFPICRRCLYQLNSGRKRRRPFSLHDREAEPCINCGDITDYDGEVACQYRKRNETMCRRRATKHVTDAYDESYFYCTQHLASINRADRIRRWRLSARPACPAHPRRQLALLQSSLQCQATLCPWSLRIPDEVLNGASGPNEQPSK